MKIIKFNDSYTDIDRIVANMLNIENAYTIYNDDLSLSENIEFYPNLTENNIQNELNPKIHYRATTGIIFYNSNLNFNLQTFVELIADKIKKYEDHLLSPKISSVTTATMIKHENIIPGTYSGKYPYFKQILNISVPARLLNYADDLKYDSISKYNPHELPPFYSTRSAFTWVFLPITKILELESFYSLNQVNAMIASIFYDRSNLCKIKDNSDIFKLSINDFNIQYIIKNKTNNVNNVNNINNVTNVDNVTDVNNVTDITYVDNVNEIFTNDIFPNENNALLITIKPKEIINLKNKNKQKIQKNNQFIATFIPNYKICMVSYLNIIEKIPTINWENIQINTIDECSCCLNKNMNTCIAIDIKSILLFDLFKKTKYTLLCLECFVLYNFGNFDCYSVINYKNNKKHEFDQQPLEEIIQGVYKILYKGSPILLIAENLGYYPTLTIPEIAQLNLPIICGVKIIIRK